MKKLKAQPLAPRTARTLHGALYVACPNCGAATPDAGFLTGRKLLHPHGYGYVQRCLVCNRDYGTDRDIAAALAGKVPA